MMQYAARNAILPSFTAFAMALGFVVSGSLLTEIVFSYPGIGYYLYQAVVSLDYPLMQAIFLFITLAVLWLIFSRTWLIRFSTRGCGAGGPKWTGHGCYATASRSLGLLFWQCSPLSPCSRPG